MTLSICRRSVIAGSAATLAAGGAVQAQAADPNAFVGEWGGALGAGVRRLRLVVTVEQGAGGYSATVRSPDQDDTPRPIEDFAVAGDRMTFTLPAIQARYEGRLVGEGRIDGTFDQRGRARPLALHRDPDWDQILQAPPLTAAYLAQLRAAAGSPALAAAARKRGGETIAAIDGVRQAGEDTLATIDDVWHWGSVTKSMTATLAALLVESGALSWETTVGEALGAAAPEMRADYRDVNLLHLMSHRAGLPANISPFDFIRYPRREDDPRESRLDWARKALAQEPIAAKGEAYFYSNSGFVIAGAILEQKLGRRWEDLITERLFEPLGLATAGFGPPGTPGALDQPVGHALGPLAAIGLSSRRRAVPAGSPAADNPAVLGPAGRVHMSLADMLLYLEAHRDGPALLTAASWERLHTPPFGGDYALGLAVRPDGSLWHNGSNTMWLAEILIDDARGVVAAAVSNDGVLASSEPAVGAALLSAADTAAG